MAGNTTPGIRKARPGMPAIRAGGSTPCRARPRAERGGQSAAGGSSAERDLLVGAPSQDWPGRKLRGRRWAAHPRQERAARGNSGPVQCQRVNQRPVRDYEISRATLMRIVKPAVEVVAVLQNCHGRVAPPCRADVPFLSRTLLWRICQTLLVATFCLLRHGGQETAFFVQVCRRAIGDWRLAFTRILLKEDPTLPSANVPALHRCLDPRAVSW